MFSRNAGAVSAIDVGSTVSKMTLSNGMSKAKLNMPKAMPRTDKSKYLGRK